MAKTSSPPPSNEGERMRVPFSAKLARLVCERLATGLTWREIAQTDGMPDLATLCEWRLRRARFKVDVEAAERIAAGVWFERALERALDTTPETLAVDKLKIATLLQHAERLDPERFGRSGARRKPAEGEARTMRIVLRRFERARREDGTEYVRAIDQVQDLEGEA
jgi:hypothetical protein